MTTEEKIKGTSCPHCRQTTLSGTHNGCYNCGKVKHSTNGKVPYLKIKVRAANA